MYTIRKGFGALLIIISFSNSISAEIETSLIRYNFKIEGIKSNVMEEALMTVPELLQKYGYPSEDHFVTTDDGYILRMHRIPKSPKVEKSLSPVFIMHGLFCSSGDWVFTGPHHGLAYFLSDRGYDVWMGNARGNRYSRNHTKLDIANDRFWTFSWHEIGYYDLPAMIDYVLNATGVEKLQYVGHSQGATSFLVMASERKEYNDKIQLAHLLAPVAYLIDFRAPMLRTSITFESGVDAFIQHMFESNQVMPYTERWIRQRLERCNTEEKIRVVCVPMMQVLTGFNPKQINHTAIPIIMGHTPAGVSKNQIFHYGQLIRSKTFVKFDYGPVANMKFYGVKKPPKYKVERITAPVIFYYSSNDLLVEPSDVDRIGKQIPGLREKYLVKMKEFSHTNYMWAIDVRRQVYIPMVERMKNVEQI